MSDIPQTQSSLRFEPAARVSESNKSSQAVDIHKSLSVKSASILKPSSNSPSFADIKQTSMDIGGEEEDGDLFGAAQSLGIHAPKKSAGNMSRVSKSSTNSERGDRLNQIFIMPFIRAATRVNESRAGRLVSTFLNKVTSKVFFWSFLSLVNISVILLIFYWASVNVLPSIHSYNLVHVVVVLLGNFQGYCSYKLCHEVVIAISAHQLLKSVSMNVFTPTYSPPEGYKLRIILGLLALSFEVFINLLSYDLDWQPVKSSVGTYACNPATYPKGFEFTFMRSKLKIYLTGEMFPGNIYSYGMPLQSGLIGGWGAMPVENPQGVFDFEVTQTGPVFIVDTDCADPIADDYVGLGTSISMVNDTSFDFSYKVRIKVMYPAYSHNAVGFEDSAVSQICDVRFLTGEAAVQMRFEQDEWDALSGGTLVNITFPDDNLSIYNQMRNPKLKPSSEIFYDEVALVLEKNKHKWAALVDWVADAFNDMLDGVPNIPPNPYVKFWYRLKYGANKGIYDVNITDRGVSGLVAASAHYALFQFDPDNVETCEFFSYSGAGNIILNDMYFLVLFAAGISLATVILFQLVWWYLSHVNDYRVDMAAENLTNQLRMMYTIKDTVASILFPHESFSSMSKLMFEKKHANILVKFGEKKTSRGKEVGELVVGLAPDVLSMRQDREYA